MYFADIQQNVLLEDENQEVYDGKNETYFTVARRE